MKLETYILGICLLIGLLTTGCSQQRREVLPEGNAVYYWRTDWRLDTTERAFLKQHHINKVYCRYFDVVMNDSLGPMPNATIRFSENLPEGIELIPTCQGDSDRLRLHCQEPQVLLRLFIGVSQLFTFHFSLLSPLHHHPPAPAVDEGAPCGLWCADAL